MKSLVKTISFFLLLAPAAFFADAQLSFLAPPFSLRANPASPNSGEKVQITASTPTFDKNTAFFRWTVDGKERNDLSGLGQNSIRLTAGAVGSITRVSAEAIKSDGESVQASLSIVPSDLAVVWSAETYTPKWYKGKALPSQGSVVNFIAIPGIVIGGRALPTAGLIYTWGLDDEDSVLSGVGQNVFRVRLSDLPKQTHDIQLTVEDSDKRIRKEARIFMNARDPVAGIYQISPLGGIEPRSALSASIAPRGTLDLIAEPFFFPVSSKKSLSYGWNANGTQSSGSPDNPDILTLNTNENTNGQMLLSLNVGGGGPYISSVAKAISIFLK